MTDRGCAALRRITQSFAAMLLGIAVVPSLAAVQEIPNQPARNARPLEWRMPVPPIQMPMLPGVMAYRPPMAPFLPGMGVDPSSLPVARPREIVNLADGDTLDLDAILVRRVINEKTFTMYGFNGQYPGPLIAVKQSATIVVNFTNRIDLPTTIHWHGVRLDNRFDGVPGVTQDPVLPGETFVYQIRFPDPGIYWYHPHVREDIQQELGLYGNMLVESPDPDYYNPVNREEVLILDDLFMDREEIVPFGKEIGNFSLMGRFGNLFLINGEPDFHLSVDRGDVVRFLLTNVSNTRTYNLVFGDAPMKVVGADMGKFQREEWVEGVVIAPAQRYVIEARFDTPGAFAITNNVQAINHVLGEFYTSVDTLGTIGVSDEPAAANYAGQFLVLRENDDVIADIEQYRPYFDRVPDRELALTLRVQEMPSVVVQFMAIDTTYFPPVELNPAMPMMNWVSNAGNLRWILREPDTRRENMDIEWEFTQGDVVKIRLFNDPNSIHPMSHPVHLHGQRMLVLERNGVRTRNLVWKDTAVIPVGATVDLLVEMSNPGKWMLHCHIAEHLEAGMMMAFTVSPSQSRN